ncbi:MAG: DeoR/GlpR family DNA-binding transcription regulator [Phototrophicaceae bacterium]
MKPRLRHEEILSLLHTQERVEVDELALRFDVSAETIRRDLAMLSEKGLLRKIHGGAARFQTAQEPSFGVRSILKSTEKQYIAQCAVELINEGDSLFIASGTTTAAFAHALTHLNELTVMTNSTIVAHELGKHPQNKHTLYLLGGIFNADESEVMGGFLVEQVRQFRADHAVVSVGSVNANGIFEYRMEAAILIRAMMEHSHNLIVLADSSKLNQASLIWISELEMVRHLVVTGTPSDELRKACEASQTMLHIAGAETDPH